MELLAQCLQDDVGLHQLLSGASRWFYLSIMTFCRSVLTKFTNNLSQTEIANMTNIFQIKFNKNSKILKDMEFDTKAERK